MLIVIGTISVITSFFLNNIISPENNSNVSEFNKFNVSFLEEIKTVGNSVVSTDRDSIKFSSGNSYIFQDGNIYKNKVIVSRGVEEFIVNVNRIDYKQIIDISISYGNSSELKKQMEYVINLENKPNSQYVDETEYTQTTLYSDELGIKPKLEDGMVPVIYREDVKSWYTTSASDPEWFDYKNKKWANVMLKDGLVVEEGTNKVLQMGSMYVYIPRFAYKIPSINYHKADEGLIDIKFLKIDNTCLDGSGEEIKSSINSNSADSGISSATNYIKHPAFTIGDKELYGIWVAKFEASSVEGNANNEEGDNVKTKTLKIVPNVASWRYISVSNAFDVCLNMSNNTTYGIVSSNSHLMKNVEWSACSFLSQSEYGKGGKVYLNNSSTYITGNSANSTSSTEVDGITNSYSSANGINASTTGNIYGIYDLSGGAWEYMSAYLNNNNTNITYGRSLKEGVDDESKVNLVDVYSVASQDEETKNYEANSTNKFGDAIWETSRKVISPYNFAWYSEYASFPSVANLFFVRGGSCLEGETAGIFAFKGSNGSPKSNVGFRPIICEK